MGVNTVQFVCSFVLYGLESSLLWTPARRLSAGQCACPWERGGKLVGVCSVCATCRRGGLSRREQLVRYLLTRLVKVDR